MMLRELATAMGPTNRSGSYRFRRRVIVGLVALAAIVAAVLAFTLSPDKNPAPQVISSIPAVTTKAPVKAPLSSDARHVAIRFIQTAVARKHLDEAWALSGPNLRGGLTRKEFLTGNNPVVPYPIDELDIAPYKIDYSYVDRALLEVALLPRKGADVRAQVFYLRLEKFGQGPSAHWMVNNWVPRAAAVTPR
jgi:hypothetical protein